MKLPTFKRLALLIFVIVPLVAWFVVKPVRVLAPGLTSVVCPARGICVDEVSKFEEAKALHTESRAFVSSALAPLHDEPKVIFCSTVACADSFGLGARSAVTVALLGTVIGPNAWKPYYVRHEMIHVIQGEKIGVVSLMFKPSWFVEGMAYALSEDPREPLAEPFESDRKIFRKWYQTTGKESVWSAANQL